ncbi:3838_t:CDS:2, partial [Funneliformis geosporum]
IWIKEKILENNYNYSNIIWKNKGGDKKTCDRLLAQIRNYELKVDPYDQDENDNIDNNSYSDSNSSDDNNNYDIKLLTEKYLLNNDREIL